MFSEIKAANESELRLPDHEGDGDEGGELGDDVADSLPFSIPPESTQIFETDFDLSSHPIGALRLGEMPLLGEPVRHIAEELRAQLHEFVHRNMRRPSGYGFLAKTYEPPTLTPILNAFKEASQKLEHIFSDRSHDDVMSIQVRSAAHRVQSGLEGFLVTMLRNSPNDLIGEGELGAVLQQCIELKGFLGTNIQQLDLMNAEYRAAIRTQLESMQNGQRSARG